MYVAEADKKCSEQEIVEVAREVPSWQEFVSVLSASIFSIKVITDIRNEHNDTFMQARRALTMWANEMDDKACRRMMIETMCRMCFRKQAVNVFGVDLVEQVCPRIES